MGSARPRRGPGNTPEGYSFSFVAILPPYAYQLLLNQHQPASKPATTHPPSRRPLLAPAFGLPDARLALRCSNSCLTHPPRARCLDLRLTGAVLAPGRPRVSTSHNSSAIARRSLSLSPSCADMGVGSQRPIRGRQTLQCSAGLDDKDVVGAQQGIRRRRGNRKSEGGLRCCGTASGGEDDGAYLAGLAEARRTFSFSTSGMLMRCARGRSSSASRRAMVMRGCAEEGSQCSSTGTSDKRLTAPLMPVALMALKRRSPAEEEVSASAAAATPCPPHSPSFCLTSCGALPS